MMLRRGHHIEAGVVGKHGKLAQLVQHLLIALIVAPDRAQPLAVVERVTGYADWMAQDGIPKLFVNAEPGAILVGPQREFCRRWRNQTEITVRGSHFIQEDSGREIGNAIARWAEQHVKAPKARR